MKTRIRPTSPQVVTVCVGVDNCTSSALSDLAISAVSSRLAGFSMGDHPFKRTKRAHDGTARTAGEFVSGTVAGRIELLDVAAELLLERPHGPFGYLQLSGELDERFSTSAPASGLESASADNRGPPVKARKSNLQAARPGAKHRLAISLAVLIAAVAASGPAYGSLKQQCWLGSFCGGYETGDFSQWWLHQWSINPDSTQSYNIYNVGNSAARIVTRPVAQGRYAAEFQVLPTTGTNPNDRAEIVASQAESGGYQGQTWWYGWWTYFPGPSQDWWHQGGDWNDITQFFSTDNVPSQMAIGIDAARHSPPVIYAEGMPFRRKQILAPLRYGHWFHFLVHARWSTGPDGFVQMWLDGTQVIQRLYGATLRNQN
ncbi:MAG: heparin lyase I family protein, partial [Solirubrobacterales bacterium]